MYWEATDCRQYVQWLGPTRAFNHKYVKNACLHPAPGMHVKQPATCGGGGGGGEAASVDFAYLLKHWTVVCWVPAVCQAHCSRCKSWQLLKTKQIRHALLVDSSDFLWTLNMIIGEACLRVSCRYALWKEGEQIVGEGYKWLAGKWETSLVRMWERECN